LSSVQALLKLSDVLKINLEIEYVADSANAPYGPKTTDFIINRCILISDFLIKKKVDLIVVACNTATTKAIEALRLSYPNRLWVGIEPGIKPASAMTQTGTIGVLATKATLESKRFQYLLEQFNKNNAGNTCSFICQVGYGWVEAVEKGQLNTEETFDLVKQTLKPINQSNADTLVLGCTHYPFLKPLVERALETQCHVIDTSEAVAQQTLRLIQKNIKQSSSISHSPQFIQLNAYTTGDEDQLKGFLTVLNWPITYWATQINL
jgi:glutamate racemase